MQPVDFTTLIALTAELRANWLPARLEQVYQRDRHTLFLGLRTLNARAWLLVSWHPQAARLCISEAPPRNPDTFTFSQQLRHQIGNLALVEIALISPWERVFDLQFARRPGDSILWHVYLEIMGKYSNVILVNQEDQIVTAAHQVSTQQSRVRPIQTGQPYEHPPVLTEATPMLQEPFDRWQERICLIPGELKRNLLKNYRGLSSALVASMLQSVGLAPDVSTSSLSPANWQELFQRWQAWLLALEHQRFQPGTTAQGYTVMGWGIMEPVDHLQKLINVYYANQLNCLEFGQLRHHLSQKLHVLLEKLRLKAQTFQIRMEQSVQADCYREQANLLMAHLHCWQSGMISITLSDFHTEEPVEIALDPEKNAVQNAQALYRQHQKLKRAHVAVAPLLASVRGEIGYLEQVEAAIANLTDYRSPDDLETLAEIRDELIQQGYLDHPDYPVAPSNQSHPTSQPYRYHSPNGLEIWVGRNNRQNDQLTFRTAGDYDLWFHTQEIPGSHVLLRLPPGVVPDPIDLAFVADVAAFHSRARHSEQVPVVYTEPKNVYRPKGAKPGMTVYKHERVIWGQPERVRKKIEDGR